jgi:hypothetical protein
VAKHWEHGEEDGKNETREVVRGHIYRAFNRLLRQCVQKIVSWNLGSLGTNWGYIHLFFPQCLWIKELPKIRGMVYPFLD